MQNRNKKYEAYEKEIENPCFCPCCGSIKIDRSVHITTDYIFDTIHFAYETVTNKCHDCAEETDIFGESDKNRQIAIMEKKLEFITKMLEINNY